MEKGNNKKTEDFLIGFSFKPAPAALKNKILDNTLKKQKSDDVMTAFLWKGFVGCIILIFIVIAVDATITHAQNKRFASVLHKQQESLEIPEEERALIRDIIGEFSGSTKSVINIKLYNLLEKEKNEKSSTGWRDSLKKEFE